MRICAEWLASMLCCVAIFIPDTMAQAQTPDLTTATIEELMNVRVTTVGKKEQPLSNAAAAVYVISREEIRRSGAQTLPEAVRLAPGVQVAQISSNAWAITIRGFNSQFANKLLVLIDGRAVYSTTYSGVFWNEQDLLLDDIERIEVIRGPGATLWGTNAVNGVINIITRPASETKGVLVGGGGGSYEHYANFGRVGGDLGTRGQWRFYVKHSSRTDLPTASGITADDGWTSTRGGFRSDWKLTSSDSLTVQGDGSGGGPNDTTAFAFQAAPFPGYSTFAAGNLLARWRHAGGSGSEFRVKVYYDHARESFPDVAELRHDIFDVDFQHNFTVMKRHEVVWGGTFRNVRQRTRGRLYTEFDPAAQTLRIFSGYIQDEVALRRHTLHLIAGSKFESNEFTGVEIQPTLRLLYTPSPRHAVWTAVSRAMRTPSEAETSVHNLMPGIVTPSGTVTGSIVGNPRLPSEELVAFEAGYRAQATRRFSVDVASFVNRYHDLVIPEAAPVSPLAPGLLPISFFPDGTAKTYGIEVVAGYVLASFWRVTGSYSWLHTERSVNRGISLSWEPFADPEHQFQVHSLLSLPGRVELDSHLYFSSRMNAWVPRHTRADVRLGWRLNEHLDCTVNGQNLLDAAHPEFYGGLTAAPIQIRRSVYGKMTWRF